MLTKKFKNFVGSVVFHSSPILIRFPFFRLIMQAVNVFSWLLAALLQLFNAMCVLQLCTALSSDLIALCVFLSMVTHTHALACV